MPTKFISVIHGGVYYKKKNSSLKTDKIIGTFPLGRYDMNWKKEHKILCIQINELETLTEATP
jgi:hypothetical protein